MFPHTITIFNVVNGVYNRKVVSDVFCHTDKIISTEGKGDKYTYAYDVIFSSEALKKYKEVVDYINLEDKTEYFTLKENDIIVIGNFPEIKDLKEVQISHSQYFLIRTISDNRYGNQLLQNIEITN